MAYSITNLKADLSGVLHGTTLNQITGLSNLINRAAGDVLLDLDPQETKRIVPITNEIFYQVYDYSCPSDLKGNKIIDIRPQTPRKLNQIWNQDYNQQFDVSKNNAQVNEFTINWNQGVRTLRINSPFSPQGTLLNQISGVTDNGTFTGSGGITNLSTNNVNFQNYGGSIQFDLSAGQGTGLIENSTMSAQDISSMVSQGVLFGWIYFPNASAITSVTLRWGSSNTDYYSKTVTTTQTGNTFADGWNLLAFDWTTATTTGSPNAQNIEYLAYSIAYDSTAQVGVLINILTSQMGTILEIEYYSDCMFRDSSTGAFKNNTTSDNDLINLGRESYNIFFYRTAFLCFQQQASKGSSQFDLPFTQQGYENAVKRYKALYKSEIQKPNQQYYQKPNYSYTRIINSFRT